MQIVLTKSEYAVASLAAQGKTDKQIAGALGLSVRTVQSYLSNGVYPKLEINSKSQLPMIFEANPPQCLSRISGWEYRAKFSELVKEPMTPKQVAALIGCKEKTAYKYLKESGNASPRHNHKVTYKDETLTLSEWAEKSGIPEFTIRDRIYLRGWAVEKALTQPVNKKHWSQKRRDDYNKNCSSELAHC